MRISTTTLESFRLFMQPENDWMSEDDLIRSIRGEFVPDAKVNLGRAFGAVLEAPDTYAVDGGYRYEGQFFATEMMAPALAKFDRRGVFEAKALKAYGPHDVVARADQLFGAQLIENKTTLSSFNFDKYAESCQWRFMTDIFEPAYVTYRVFCLSQYDDGQVALKSIEEFNLYPYAALHRDCCALLGDFVAFVTAKGLDAVLNDRQRLAEVA